MENDGILFHCLPADAGRIYVDGCFLRCGAGSFTTVASDTSDMFLCLNDTALATPRAAALVCNVTPQIGRASCRERVS